jgi:hypothetical protein
MREIKTYSKGAPFYNAFIGTWPSHQVSTSYSGKFVVSKADEEYDARDRGPNLKFRFIP